MKYHFACPVWGQRALSIFLEVGLPSQLAALEGFEHLETSTYFIYTTSADAGAIQLHPIYGALLRLMPVEFIIDDQLSARATWWDSFTECHRQQVKRADDADAATFFLCADQIWTVGSFTKAAWHIERGASAVVCAGPRIAHDAAYPALTGMVVHHVLSVHASYLMQRAFSDWLHPECRDSFFDAENYIQYVSYMLFHVKDEGVVGRCYVLHPVVVKAEVKHARPNFAIFDQDYLNAACPDVSRVHVVVSSSEICHVSLAPTVMAYAQPTDDRYRDPIQAQAWFAEGPYWGPLQRYFSSYAIYLYYETTPNWEKWDEVVQRSQRIVECVDRVLQMSDWDLLQHYPANLLRRYERRQKYGEILQGDLSQLAATMVELRRHRVWKNPMDGHA